MSASSLRLNSIATATAAPRKAQGEDSRETIVRTFADAVDVVAHQSRNEHGQRMSVGDIAERIGRSENYLGKAVSKYDDAHPLRGDLIVPLTLATKNYALLQHLATAVGGVFFPLPAVDDNGKNLDVIEQTANVVGEFGDVLTDVRRALADGIVTPEEAERVAIEGNEAIAEIARLINLVQRKAQAR